ncbi:MAG TPA: carbamoyltransferase C-terminal domain-containing protein [Pyrinomonadaceae bacterium]|jgi:carbamoyltransferase|nr:carbamoyltransferase C-terminal domain-containing protein [Pyrinomonadaceae bacterium]
MYVLGINAYHGDAAAAIIRDGKLIAAVEEERFNRVKHCAGFPEQSISYCLEAAGIGLADVDHIGISRDPSAHLNKKVLFAASRAAKGVGGAGAGLINQIKDRLGNAAKVRDLKSELARVFSIPKSRIGAQFHNVEHHRAHLASCFYTSPFERAALLSIDGFGDFISTMWAMGEGHDIEILGQVEYPHSIGIVYTATTQFLGFPHYGDEGKVMGLAPYGRPRFIDEFREIVRTEENGQFRLDLDYFRHHAEGVEMTWDGGSPVIGRIYSDRFAETFGPPRAPGSALSDREHDIAASLQLRLEEVAFHVLNRLHEQTGTTDLGLAGGVAYNSVMNGKILLQTPFRRVFVQPAAGDSGTAIGVCYEIAKRREHMPHAYAGPEFSSDQIRAALTNANLQFETYTDEEVTKRAAHDIAAGLVVGWFQGKMEFGPRALGNRSIVVDPRRAEMKDILNDRIKKREPFRPFAPSILEERVGDYFEQTHPAPTMLMVYQVRAERRAEIPAVTHVDGSGRLQTVARETNARYYQLISDFNDLTGVPVLLNTSFNENEPVVCTPDHAVDCFLKTRMDALYIGNYVTRRRQS